MLPTRAALPTVTLTPQPTIVAQAPTIERPTFPPSWTPTDTPTHTSTPNPTEVEATITAQPEWLLTMSPAPSKTPTITYTPTDTFTPTVSPTPSDTPTPEGNASITGENGANLREGPSTAFSPPLTLLDPGTEVTIIGRTSDNGWFEIRTFNREGGWVSANLIEARISTTDLPVRWDGVLPEAAGPAPPPAPVNVNIPGFTSVSGRVRQIHAAGRARGMRPNVFTTVGDSITAGQGFMRGYGYGNYDLGDYAYLQTTIDFFGVSPRDGVQNSFVNRSVAARPGFSTVSVLTAAFADRSLCQPNEPPLNCEFRLTRPSVVIIMLGSVDVQQRGAWEYKETMRRIVQTSIDSGVIPVLTTFPNGQQFYADPARELNAALRDLAREEQIPLIDLLAVADTMPNGGLRADNFHLSERGFGDEHVALTGEQAYFGLTQRNMLTLMTLDVLRREVLAR